MSSIKVYLLNKSNNLGYSDDLCATIVPCGTSVLTPYLIAQDIAAKKTDSNFVFAVGTYLSGGAQGIIYSTDGGNTFTQPTGSWLSSITSGDTFRKICICPNDENVIYTSTTQDIVAKSTDGGLTFSSVGTTSSISGLPPGANTRSVYSTNGVDVVVSINTNVYYSNDGGTSWAIVGAAVDGVNEPFGIYVNDGGTLFLAVTISGVFSSTGGAWSSVFAFPSPLSTGTRVVLSYVGADTFYTVDDANVYLTTDNFVTTTSVYTIQDLTNGVFDMEFYNPTSGLIIDNFSPNFGLRTVDSFTNDIPILDTFGQPRKLAIGTYPACGCPPGFIFNNDTQFCESSTPVCPDGYVYDADSDLCEAPSEPCDLDLAIVIDRSSSITATEYPLYKAFIENIIDAIQDNGNTNRISTDQVRIGIVYFGTSSPVAGAAGLPLQIGGWVSGTGNGMLKANINAMGVIGNNTNHFAGLREGYKNVTGVNSRASAAKKILFITDGWPNQSDPTTGVFNGYTQVPSTPDGDCVPLFGIVGVNGSTEPLNICHGSSDLSGDVNTSVFTVRKRRMYTDAMDLAQDIKNGNIGGTGTSPEIDITLVIVGNQNERTTTKNALVGANPTGTGATDYCKFNVNDWALLDGSITATNCKYWDASYEFDSPPGSGNWLRFPSNNIAGNPDYYETEFANYADIVTGITTSLLCTVTAPALPCNDPCVLNTVTGECECVSTDYNPCCYDLINCADGSIYATVNTNSSGFDNLAEYVGSIVVFEGLPECLFVTVTSACNGQTTIENLNITETFTTCQECQQAIEINPCYKLTNCNNGDVFIMTQQNLNQFAGLVVELAEYPGLCWTVLETYNCVGEFTTVSIVQSYPDCECCFQYQCV
jgi:hypothetical protein